MNVSGTSRSPIDCNGCNHAPGRCPRCALVLMRSTRTNSIPIFVIYDRPSDFPNHIVVRLWRTERMSMAWTFATLEEARAALPLDDLVRLERFEEDDPTIVEVWL